MRTRRGGRVRGLGLTHRRLRLARCVTLCLWLLFLPTLLLLQEGKRTFRHRRYPIHPFQRLNYDWWLQFLAFRRPESHCGLVWQLVGMLRVPCGRAAGCHVCSLLIARALRGLRRGRCHLPMGPKRARVPRELPLRCLLRRERRMRSPARTLLFLRRWTGLWLLPWEMVIFQGE